MVHFNCKHWQTKKQNTLRVEIDQFRDGYRDTMRSSYVIDKM